MPVSLQAFPGDDAVCAYFSSECSSAVFTFELLRQRVLGGSFFSVEAVSPLE